MPSPMACVVRGQTHITKRGVFGAWLKGETVLRDGTMDSAAKAVEALTALGHETRLQIFRLLVREGPSGRSAGAIATEIGCPKSTLSHHLSLLERAGLLTARRQDRHIFYAIDISGTRALFDFLTADCCNGRPELCGPLVAGAFVGELDRCGGV